MAWNQKMFQVRKSKRSVQAFHLKGRNLSIQEIFYVTFVYGLNDYSDRRKLWDEIVAYFKTIQNHLWVILGDFNVINEMNEKRRGLDR